MCSRAFAPWLIALLGGGCAGVSSTESRIGSATELGGGGVLGAQTPCSSPSWHVLQGPVIGRGDQPARHREPEVKLNVEQSAGFELGRSSVVHSAQGDQLLVEIENLQQRWRCGIRSFPSLAFDAQGNRVNRPAADDMGYEVLAATGMDITTRQGIRGTCLGPGELGYLQIKLTKEIASVTVRLEANDALQSGPPPTCVVPESYSFAAGLLSIQAHRAGLADPTYKRAQGGGLTMALALDEEQLPLAMFSLAPNMSDATEAEMSTFVGAISLNAGTSQSLAALVW